eukprot:gnl/TRDRNA2_/TRDRNA2_173960_c0_seq10.p1 gnl/TRDRNA2_/TRDRNA2_173960_c0~~gnl/TRDRNA2_/TRDRNA2_173960_c0_seq10.p1  ORF type:complete len:457 (-),score=41.48 gnl/TRDRNA2_/TRDRNA2_173960_c0_seq10:183-1553(-)
MAVRYLPFMFICLCSVLAAAIRISDGSPALANRYLVLVDAHEGGGSWRWSVVELIDLAAKAGANFVSPCFYKGRLGPCGVATNPTHSLLDIYDKAGLQTMLGPRGKVMTHDEFTNATRDQNLSTAVWCGLGSAKLARPYCKWHMQEHPEHEEISINFNSSLKEVMRSWGNKQVLMVYHYWRNHLNIGHHALASGIEQLNFTAALWQQASQYQAALGLSPDFRAIQWRSEHHEKYLGECSSFLAEHFGSQGNTVNTSEGQGGPLKLAGKSKLGNHTLLISDISVDPDKVIWKEMLKRRTSKMQQRQHEALQGLFKHGFVKLDQLTSARAMDVGLMSLIDQIFAVTAKQFITCLDKSSSICQRCFRTTSSFAREIIEERQKENKMFGLSWQSSFQGNSSAQLSAKQGPDVNSSAWKAELRRYASSRFQGSGCQAFSEDGLVLSACDSDSWNGDYPDIE